MYICTIERVCYTEASFVVLTVLGMINFRSIIGYVENCLLSLLPVSDKIVFLNFWGRGYGDSPKYIADEILRQELPCDLVWLVQDMKSEMPGKIRKIKYYSHKSRIELATARVIISNVKYGLPFRKKKSQYYIQTWHGGFAVKYIEKEIENMLSRQYVRKSKYDSSITDLILSGSEFQTKIIKDAFWYNGEILKKGIPRNDIFFNVTDEKVHLLKQKYGFHHTDKIVLYAPTFRDNKDSEAYDLDAGILLETLAERTGLHWKLIVRLHPLAACHRNMFDYDKHVIDGSGFSDPQELLVISDLLITDFSSMMMDFAIMYKPVILYITDLEQYIKSCRDIRPIFYKLPFVFAKSNDELHSAILMYDEQKYKRNLKAFMDEHFQSYDDGHASEYVVDRIKMVLSLK